MGGAISEEFLVQIGESHGPWWMALDLRSAESGTKPFFAEARHNYVSFFTESCRETSAHTHPTQSKMLISRQDLDLDDDEARGDPEMVQTRRARPPVLLAIPCSVSM